MSDFGKPLTPMQDMWNSLSQILYERGGYAERLHIPDDEQAWSVLHEFFFLGVAAVTRTVGPMHPKRGDIDEDAKLEYLTIYLEMNRALANKDTDTLLRKIMKGDDPA
ncbi:hypothetical protein B0G84_3244 [Paraburkholderia sp. BL8N3]|nr:hypothetical protein [Paraburkholderia sp. BL8N3]TCK37946.1 hypothetical protein B0G84_3244 [Paraburkholderia sp. BL8N3]